MKKLLLMSAASLLMSCAGAADSKDTAMPLAGSEWGTELEGQFIQFKQDGKVMGNGGCNRFGGPYTQDGDSLKIGPLMATKMACMKLKEENLFFAVLEDTRSANISHMTLALKDEGGIVLLTLKRRDWD